uniref:Uncharacterized protein n=1 Tax=Anguilla anguilla TaxID=7936 RepID=A0A0E9XNI7_ANGAN
MVLDIDCSSPTESVIMGYLFYYLIWLFSVWLLILFNFSAFIFWHYVYCISFIQKCIKM